MSIQFARNFRLVAASLAAPLLIWGYAPAIAQEMQTVDPDSVIDADLMDNPGSTDAAAYEDAYDVSEATPRYESPDVYQTDPNQSDTARPAFDLPPEQPDYASANTSPTVDTVPREAERPTTYAQDDLIGAAEGLFGQGAEGLARLIQNILSDQGEPNGYIVGREGGGAFVLGVRYGSGTLYHAVEGNMPVYWTGPSIGLDAGANAGNTFVLIYNLYDTDDLYERYPAGEGQAYFVGGFHASYVRKGDVVMIPIRVGAGLRLGVNAGYLRFSRNQRWLPF
ncbi:DUF1134 domain-containing protein [Aurantiacibacter marinus]|uniref:DUF1134 domain-containing protein n=1 Tax=Aurantiacibacter marinus TaxID=874156 RepID=A0A0H0XQZ1_9SPHN|nr:DUF1134 domain-containing protein [Aurantiacibacter marinus]KLI65023.1 hypothetical protein AAV99_06020 [Aurantiacibacter marinus]